MLRGLYRFYLYNVVLALLFFATGSTENVLQKLFARTIFPVAYAQPTQNDFVQALTLAVVAWLSTILFGGLHYWLIRRDIAHDPSGKNSAVRAFLLNATEAIILPIAVGVGGSAISMIGSLDASSYGSFFLNLEVALSLSLLLLWSLLEWERRRIEPEAGTALVFQRLHLYGVQLILLFTLSSFWFNLIGRIIDKVFFAGKAALESCGGYSGCADANVLSQLFALLWVVAFWLAYSFFTHKDTDSQLRKVLHYISFGYGVIWTLTGIYRMVMVILLAVLKTPAALHDIVWVNGQYEFASPLSLGLLVMAIYSFWLWKASRQQGKNTSSVIATFLAVSSTVMGLTFWLGCGWLLFAAIQRVTHTTSISTQTWASAWSLVMAGAGYIGLDIMQRRFARSTGYITAMRGMFLVLLGAGIVAEAVGGAFALYAYLTAQLGASFSDWQSSVQGGLAGLIVGFIVMALYLWSALEKQLLVKRTQQTSATAPATITASTDAIRQPTPDTHMTKVEEDVAIQPTTSLVEMQIGEVLDGLESNRIGRDEAVERLKEMMQKA